MTPGLYDKSNSSSKPNSNILELLQHTFFTLTLSISLYFLSINKKIKTSIDIILSINYKIT